MQRTLTFSPEANKTFILLYTAFLQGGNQQYRSANGQRPPEERRREAKILRALNSVSIITDPETGARKLAPEGGAVTLDQGLFVLLEKYTEQAPIPTEVSLEHADLLDWLSAAPKVEEEKG
jgi:hypothetical protein